MNVFDVCLFVFPERMVVVTKKGYERICESMVARSSCEKVIAFMSVFNDSFDIVRMLLH